MSPSFDLTRSLAIVDDKDFVTKFWLLSSFSRPMKSADDFNQTLKWYPSEKVEMQRVAIERMEILLLQSRYKRQNGQRKGTLGQAGLNGRANGLFSLLGQFPLSQVAGRRRFGWWYFR